MRKKTIEIREMIKVNCHYLLSIYVPEIVLRILHTCDQNALKELLPLQFIYALTVAQSNKISHSSYHSVAEPGFVYVCPAYLCKCFISSIFNILSLCVRNQVKH